tara:strand:+ start:803 stop:1954 length:1152 start_codon:yes stop_codon:yes gene_type:complete
MKPGDYAIVGASESTKIGKVEELSGMGLLLNAAANTLQDAGLKARDIDGITTGYYPPANVAQHLGIQPNWADSTVVGGAAWMYQLRNAVAAIDAGYCNNVLITYGESGRSHGLPISYDIGASGSTEQQFTLPYTSGIRAALFAIPLVRYMNEFGLTEEQLAYVHVAQRKWAAKNPRAKLREPVSVEEILATPEITWPIRRSMCCLVSDAGGALVVTRADRAKDFPKPPVYILGSGAGIDSGIFDPTAIKDLLRPSLIQRAGKQAFSSAGCRHEDIDHLMIYDAFAHLPIYTLEGLGFVDYGEAGAYIQEGNTEPGGKLPLNTNGGGLCYAHSGSYGMLCMQESIRQVRGEAAAQVEGVNTSLAFGWGGMWSACAAVIFSNQQI